MVPEILVVMVVVAAVIKRYFTTSVERDLL